MRTVVKGPWETPTEKAAHQQNIVHDLLDIMRDVYRGDIIELEVRAKTRAGESLIYRSGGGKTRFGTDGNT